MIAFILVTPLENRALNRYDTPKNKIEIINLYIGDGIT